MADKKANIQWLDTLRTLATLGVIVIHISSPIINMAFAGNMNHWWIGNVLMSLTRYAVPMFLMLSGATMITREYDVKEFYKKRLTRVILPFLFWMVVYFFFRYFTLPVKNPPTGISSILSWAGNLFLNEGVSKHFWYIYMIIFIYLFVPILGKFARSVKSSVMLVILAIWICIAVYSTRFPANMYQFTSTARLVKYVIYAGYLFLGYFLYKNIEINKNQRIAALLIFASTVAVSAIYTYAVSISKKSADQSIYNYLSFNTILQTASLFILIKNVSLKSNILQKLNATISDYSYGIYLVHVMVLGIFYNHGIFWTMAHPLISVPVVFILTLITSFITISILRKIPYGKYISG